MKDLEHHQRIKLELGYDTLTTTTITKVESTLDKLKDTRVVNNEAGRYNHVYEYPHTALLTTFSIVLTIFTGGIQCLHDDACLYDLV